MQEVIDVTTEGLELRPELTFESPFEYLDAYLDAVEKELRSQLNQSDPDMVNLLSVLYALRVIFEVDKKNESDVSNCLDLLEVYLLDEICSYCDLRDIAFKC